MRRVFRLHCPARGRIGRLCPANRRNQWKTHAALSVERTRPGLGEAWRRRRPEPRRPRRPGHHQREDGRDLLGLVLGNERQPELGRVGDARLLRAVRNDARVQHHHPVLRDPADEPDEHVLGRHVESADQRDRLRASRRRSGSTSTTHAVDGSTIYEVFLPPTSYASFGNYDSCGGPNLVYCAYHSNFSHNGTDVKYASLPYPSCGGCQWTGFTAAQNFEHFACHETREAVTDPDGNAWYDRRGNEADDKCAWSPAPFIGTRRIRLPVGVVQRRLGLRQEPVALPSHPIRMAPPSAGALRVSLPKK